MTNLATLSLASSTRDICCGMSSKLDLSVKEKRNNTASARSLHAWEERWKIYYNAHGTLGKNIITMEEIGLKYGAFSKI